MSINFGNFIHLFTFGYKILHYRIYKSRSSLKSKGTIS